VIQGMADRDTAAHLREWVKKPPAGAFAWATDACGYDQHIRFVKRRNANWRGEGSFNDFILAYADLLDPPTPSAAEPGERGER
jgi:hypothetical protein